MITSAKCNCCIHDKVCAFKEEYLAACNAIKEASYSKTTGTTVEHIMMKNSIVDISIRCPHIITQSALNTVRGDISA